MWDFILDILTDPILELICGFFRRGKSPESSKLFPREDMGPITEEEILRDKLEAFSRDRNRNV